MKKNNKRDFNELNDSYYISFGSLFPVTRNIIGVSSLPDNINRYNVSSRYWTQASLSCIQSLEFFHFILASSLILYDFSLQAFFWTTHDSNIYRRTFRLNGEKVWKREENFRCNKSLFPTIFEFLLWFEMMASADLPVYHCKIELKPNLTLNINQLNGMQWRLLEILSNRFLLFTWAILNLMEIVIFILSFEFYFEENLILMEIEILVGIMMTHFLWELCKGNIYN